jgi:hypothetical protein
MLLQTGAQCGPGLLLGEPATSIVSHILLIPSLLDRPQTSQVQQQPFCTGQKGKVLLLFFKNTHCCTGKRCRIHHLPLYRP